MKTNYFFFLILSSLLFIYACQEEPAPTPTTDICETLLIGRDGFLTAERDAFDFKSAVIDTNCLEITVTYGGGCGDANFDLIYIGTLNSTNPPSAPLVLSFDDQDPCEAAIDTTLRFSLIGVQDSNYSEIVLDIEGFNPGSPLRYTYEW